MAGQRTFRFRRGDAPVPSDIAPSQGDPECVAGAFSPEGACPECLSLVESDPITPKLTGTVDTATTIAQGAPSEFVEQQAKQGSFGVGIVSFPAGPSDFSLPIQMIGEMSVEETVYAFPRRIYVVEGVPRYALNALSE